MATHQGAVKVWGDWEAFEDDSSGVMYYYNKSTDTTQWDMPAGWPSTPTIHSIHDAEGEVQERAALSPKGHHPRFFSSSQAHPSVQVAQHAAPDNRGSYSQPGLTSVSNISVSNAHPSQEQLIASDELPQAQKKIALPSLMFGRKQALQDLVRHTSSEADLTAVGPPPVRPLSVVDESSKTSRSNTSRSTDAPPKDYVRPDYDPDDPYKVNVPRRYVICTRIVVCFIAIILLWCTTLNVSRGIAANFLQAPPTRVVVKSWETVVGVTEFERDGHTWCVQLEMDDCHAALNKSILDLTTNANTRVAYNNRLVAEFNGYSTQCTTYTSQLFFSLKQWQRNSTITRTFDKIFNTTANCTAEERDKIKLWAEDIGDTRSATWSEIRAYSKNSSSIINQTADQLALRLAYDQSYVDNKTQKLQDEAAKIKAVGVSVDFGIEANMSDAYARARDCMVNPDQGQCPQQSLVQGYAVLEQQLNESYKTLHKVAELNYQVANQYGSAVVSLLNQVDSFFDVLSDAASELAGIGISIPTSLFSAVASFPAISIISTPPLNAIESIGSFFDRQINPINDDFAASVAEVNAKMNAELERRRLMLSKLINDTTVGVNVLEDYNPPSAFVDRSQHDNNTELFLSNTQAQLNIADNEAGSADANNLTVAAIQARFDQLELSELPFNQKNFGGSVQFRPMIESVDKLIWFLMFLDYIWRAFQTLYIIVKYWTMSAVGLPVIDIRKNAAAKKGTPVAVKAATVATNKWVVVPVFVIIVSVLIAQIVDAYVPIYNSYQEGCVKSHDGTVLANNSFSLSYNIATTDGDQERVKGVADYDERRNEACTTYSERTAADQSSAQSSVDNYRRSVELNIEKVDLFLKCVNQSAFDAIDDYYVHNPPRPIEIAGFAYSGSACKAPRLYSEELQDARFNCSLLPACKDNCDGPNEYILRQSTFEASCRSEAMVHAAVWRTIVAVMVYICINLSRGLIMAGITRLFWRSLTPFGFNYIANCGRTGKTDSNQQKLLNKQLYRDLVKYEFMAVMYLLGALALHLPYIIVLSTISNPVEESSEFSQQR